MILLFTLAQRLRQRYGEAHWDRLRASLVDLADAYTLTHGAAALCLPDEFWPPGSDANAVELIRSELEARAPIEALVIIGGDSVVPFGRAPNPVADRVADPDSLVLSDAVYGSPWSLAGARVPVARIPDSDPPELGELLSLLEAARPDSRGSSRRGAFAVANPEWEAATWRALKGHRPTVRVAPHWHGGDPEWPSNDAALLYFNLHGFARRPEWFGFHDRSGWTPVLRPGNIQREAVAGAIVFVENCYGGNTVGRSRRSSISLALLACGARAIIATAGLAFGSHLPSMEHNADALASATLSALSTGASVGAALDRARQALPGDDAFAAKTRSQFLIFGDPLATL